MYDPIRFPPDERQRSLRRLAAFGRSASWDADRRLVACCSEFKPAFAKWQKMVLAPAADHADRSSSHYVACMAGLAVWCELLSELRELSPVTDAGASAKVGVAVLLSEAWGRLDADAEQFLQDATDELRRVTWSGSRAADSWAFRIGVVIRASPARWAGRLADRLRRSQSVGTKWPPM